MAKPDHTFTCPECGSHHFGSSEESDKRLIHCHGTKKPEPGVAVGQPCRWSAPYTPEGLGQVAYARLTRDAGKTAMQVAYWPATSNELE